LVPEEVKKYVKGMYGRSPAPIDPKFIKKILGEEKPIDHRPADDLKPILPTATKNISNPELIQDEEDILSYCLFPEIAMEFFKWRATPEGKRPKSPADLEIEELAKSKETPKVVQQVPKYDGNMDPMLHADDYQGINSILEKASRIQLNELIIRKGDFNLSISSGSGGTMRQSIPTEISNEKSVAEKTEAPVVSEPEKKDEPVTSANGHGETIDAVMAGTFYSAATESDPPFVKEGTVVNKGDIICILEAMKLFNEIQAPVNCKIMKVLVENGTKITKGQPLMAIEKL
jgi:oxaloacetate decarboxylase (Na+ extruding) subunit alpha